VQCLHPGGRPRGDALHARDQGRALDDRIRLGKLLCHRCECERLAGDLADARATLTEAATIARDVAASPDSYPGKGIAQLRAPLGGDAAAPAG
jgi:hypothetical protein